VSLMAQRQKETVLELGKFIDKGVHVKLSGGREGAHGRGKEPSHAPALSTRG